MLKKYGVMAGVLLLPAILSGCIADIYTNSTGYGTYYPDVVVVGDTIPDDYGRKPSYTYGQGSRNPIIQAFTANPTNVTQQQPITFQVVAYDSENEVLQFNWSATGGTLSTNTGQVVSWIPPTTPGVYTVMVTVANGRGGFVMGSQNLTVQGDGTAGIGGKPGSPVPVPTVVPSPQPSPTPVATPTPAPTATVTATPAPTPTPAATQAPDRATISGVVKDDAGPLKDAVVTLLANDASQKELASFTTSEDGKFRFFNVDAGGTLILSAKKTGYSEKLRTIQALKGIDNQFDFDGTFALKRN